MLIEPHRAWLTARGLTDETIGRFGLHTQSDGRGQWLRVPYVEWGQTVNHKWRKTGAKHHMMDKDAPLLLFNHAALEHAAKVAGVLTITEGEWDALSAIQCGQEDTVSVPNGAPQTATDDVFDATRYEWYTRHAKELDAVKRFILATDSDEAGRILAADLARLLGPERCMFVEYPEDCKDLNEVLLKHGAETVVEVLAKAKPYPVAGLYTLDEFPEPPPFRAVGNGIVGLEDLWPVVPGTFSVVTGWPGHGKSTAVLVAIANLIAQGLPVALGSFETMIKPVLQRRMRACYYRCDEDMDPRVRQRGPADDAFAEKLRIISNLHVTDETELDIVTIIENAIVAVVRDGVRLLVLDPWNEIEHKRGKDENETEYVGRAIRLLKRFARDYQCAVWVIAHPRKPSSDGAPKRPSLLDLAGSANFANKADYGVIFHRPFPDQPLVEAVVTKKRMGLPGAMGRVNLLWNVNTSGYELDMQVP